MKLSITSYNIKFSTFIFDDEVERVVGHLASDIVCFQEFPLRKLSVWRECLRRIGYLDVLFQKTCETLLGVEQANVIFSKYPLEDRHSLDLTYKDHEARKAQYCVADLGGEKVFLLHTHLGLRRAERLCQMEKITKVLEQHSESEKMILLGDFNDWNNAGERKLGGFFHEAHHVLHGRCAKSFPARLPMVRLDRIYFRNISAHSCELLNDKFIKKKSDHLPLRAEFSIS